MCNWGKWVAENREPNKHSRIWLGSYSSPVAAASAYDTAVFLIRCPTAHLNFPDCFPEYGQQDLSAAAIRKKATEVGARVDIEAERITIFTDYVYNWEVLEIGIFYGVGGRILVDEASEAADDAGSGTESHRLFPEEGRPRNVDSPRHCR
ncbi:hypothetical protein SASPL_143880 [Salvia splendens]|uniref:AP2/ERF domain-containing protein n=1 Tax=Salvia splendens TaxID=180675 RepID=A0A8X8WLL4_SALSN|nr:hypothetical protein SASPL_143880 [Salvia splendens]